MSLFESPAQLAAKAPAHNPQLGNPDDVLTPDEVPTPIPAPASAPEPTPTLLPRPVPVAPRPVAPGGPPSPVLVTEDPWFQNMRVGPDWKPKY
jgi:hypothetical protein